MCSMWDLQRLLELLQLELEEGMNHHMGFGSRIWGGVLCKVSKYP